MRGEFLLMLLHFNAPWKKRGIADLEICYFLMFQVRDVISTIHLLGKQHSMQIFTEHLKDKQEFWSVCFVKCMRTPSSRNSETPKIIIKVKVAWAGWPIRVEANGALFPPFLHFVQWIGASSGGESSGEGQIYTRKSRRQWEWMSSVFKSVFM